MPTINKSVGVLVLTATLSLSALADYGPGNYPYQPNRNHSGRAHNSDWVAPLLFLGLAGAVISANSNRSNPNPPVTYYSPRPEYGPAPTTYYSTIEVTPAPPPVPANPWYFCPSVGKYYPYTQYCPEGWQPVQGQR